MADKSSGKSILDAYSDRTDDTTVAPALPSAGTSILDAYRTMPGETVVAPTISLNGEGYFAGAPLTPDQLTATRDAFGRIDRAMGAGWRAFDPETTATSDINQGSWLGRYGIHPLVQVSSLPFRAMGAVGAGLGEGAMELGNMLDPRLGRDLHMANEVLSTLLPLAGMPKAGMMAPEVNPLATTRATELLTPERPRPAFMPPNALEPPPPTPPFVPPGGAPRPSEMGEPPPAGATRPGTTPPPSAGAVPPVSPTSAPSARIAPIITQAQAEAEADRILRHFAGDQTPVINPAPLASGAQPTLSQSIEGGHGGIAGLERGVRDVPEQTQHFVTRETANTTARNKAVGDVIGDSRATDVVEAQLNARTAPKEAVIFDPARTKPVDPSEAIALLDKIRAGPAGQRDAVAEGLDHLRGKLIDKDGKMQTDPAQLRGVDLAIKDMISPKAASTKQDFRAAAHELMAVRDVLRDNIEQGAPGYKGFLAQQAAERSAIDGQRFLQARNITDRNGNVNLGTLDATIKAAESQQRLPGARLADGVTDEQLARLKELRADYQNDAKQRLGTSLGSPTVQKLGVSGSMGVMGHPLLAGAVGTGGALAAGVNPLLGTALGVASYALKQQSFKAQRMVMDALRDKLLNPEKARSAFTRP